MGRGEVHTKFWWEKLREKDLEHSGVGGRIISKLIFEKWEEGVDWIDLAQHRDRWWALVNAAMNLRVP